MRLGVGWDPNTNSWYRAVLPMKAMEQRGHEVLWPPADGDLDVARLAGCDVVHVYRRCIPETQRAVTQLIRLGTPVTYDNDDDFTTVPKESEVYKLAGGLKGQRIHAMTVKVAKAAQRFTTTSEVLAEKYRRDGVEHVDVIGNYLGADVLGRPERHSGTVIGWVAGWEHVADAARIGIADALERLLAAHPDVRVECIGVDLKLSERYRHDRFVSFHDLPGRIRQFDVGIAPLADLPVNRARSDVKLKEYAAAGVPWLASPVGPYLGLGEKEGGRLVADDAWFEELDRLVSRPRERRRLARKARGWAKTQTIEAVAQRWESVFESAAAARARG